MPGKCWTTEVGPRPCLIKLKPFKRMIYSEVRSDLRSYRERREHGASKPSLFILIMLNTVSIGVIEENGLPKAKCQQIVFFTADNI